MATLAACAVQPESVLRVRHTSHGPRSGMEHKQVRIERSKSTAPNVNCADCHLNLDSLTDTAISSYAKNEENNNNMKPSFKRRESTMFLTSARRQSTTRLHVQEPDVLRVATPLNIEDLTEDELDAYFFDDPDPEPDKSNFDVSQYYKSTCEKEGLLPSSTFLRQLDKPKCNLANLMMTHEDIKPIAVALVNNSKISELDLSENNLGKNGIFHIAEALKENVFITRVKMSCVGFDASSMRYLQEGLRSNKTLKHLDLSANHLNSKSAVYLGKLIQENDFIEELILKENDLDDPAGTILSSAIASNLTLRFLDLSWNHLRCNGAADVVKAICENVELTDVNLSWNGLGEEGSRALAKYFHKNHTLRTLDITNTRISYINLGYVLKGISGNDTLETLKVTGNPFSTDGAIAILRCIEMSPNSALKHVHLEDTPINDEFIDAYDDLKNKKDVCVYHKEPNKKKIAFVYKDKAIDDYDPLLLLFEFMRQEGFRLIDLFRQFDKNHDNILTKEELKDGFLKFSLNLSDDKLSALMNRLDLDQNQIIDFNEMIYGKQRASEIRFAAEKNKSERLRQNMSHLKSLVNKARKDKLKKLERSIGNNDAKREKAALRRQSSVLSIEFPLELREALESNEAMNK